jgi:hypothetical protein
MLLGVLPWVLGLAFQIYDWRTDVQVAARQTMTSGIVTDHLPSNHNMYAYDFSVNGRRYTGWQSPRSNELAIGKTVTVYYDPQNPSKNSLVNFDDLSTESLGPVPLLLFGIGTIALFIWYKRRHTVAATNCW